MSEVEAVQQLQEWADDDRTAARVKRGDVDLDSQLDAIKWVSAVGPADARASLSDAQVSSLAELAKQEVTAEDEAAAVLLDATADGWEEVISAVDQQAPSS